MKRHLFYLTTTLFLAGCAQDFDLMSPVAEPQQEVVTSRALTRSLNGAIYNEVTGGWMIPQEDPYSLANFQKAYDNIVAKKNTKSLTRAQIAEFKAEKRLAPTHYALKIYPKSKEEQWRVETMEDVNVAYIPFCFSQLTQDEVSRVEKSGKTRSAANAFIEKSPYTFTYDNMESSDGVPVEPEVVQLPILYTVWPVEKPLPEDLEYVMDYEVFLPHAASETNSIEVLTILQDEAQMSALGYLMPMPVTKTSMETRAGNGGGSYLAHGYFVFMDNALFNFSTGLTTVPMAGLEVTYQIGSNTDTAITNSEGLFSLNMPYGLDSGFDLPVTLNYKSPYWNIRCYREGFLELASQKLYVRVTNMPVAASYPRVPVNELPLADPRYRMLYNVHRAANYFFNVQTSFPKYMHPGGLDIVVHDYSDNTMSGALRYNTVVDDCYIKIYNNTISESNNYVMATTLHELGHFTHYKAVGYNNYPYTHKLLKESFASYCGWYLGEAYLKSIGWTKSSLISTPSGGWLAPPVDSGVTGEARQDWQKTWGVTVVTSNSYMKYYSPLFIDLTDDHNQFVNAANFPLDIVKGAEPSVIWNIIKTSKDWVQCRPQLESWVNARYGSDSSEAELYRVGYIRALNEWFIYNPD